jgi:hypothetical protein
VFSNADDTQSNYPSSTWVRVLAECVVSDSKFYVGCRSTPPFVAITAPGNVARVKSKRSRSADGFVALVTRELGLIVERV